MGILDSGALGPFRKKVGANIGRKHMGQDLILPLYQKTTKKPTGGQLSVRARFGLLSSFMKSISPLLDRGFKEYAKKKSSSNAAYRYNYGHAFVANGTGWLLNYPALVYSRGDISTPDGLTVNRNVDGVSFNWSAQPQSSYCQFTDLATFVVYCPESDLFRVSKDAVQRQALGFELDLPSDFLGVLHCYMSFISADGKLMGDSVYAGGLG